LSAFKAIERLERVGHAPSSKPAPVAHWPRNIRTVAERAIRADRTSERFLSISRQRESA
jgi:hypothetical protein